MRHSLHIDWATHGATVHACENWHYSRAIPRGKLVKIGAWENSKFVGVVVFGRGANRNMLNPYGLSQDEGCELVRVALRAHASPVSMIMSRAIKMLRKKDNLRLIVSYADPEQGHRGGIYQASNWIYAGKSVKAKKVFYKGRWRHQKMVDDARVCQKKLPKKIQDGKHIYLMPLDRKIRKELASIARPYPKSVQSIGNDASGDQPGEGGVIPTCTLQGVAHG